MSTKNGFKPFQLDDRVILVTGGANGIGRAVTLCAMGLGARVMAVDLDRSGLEELEAMANADTRAGPAALATLVGNVTDIEFVQRSVNETIKRFGTINSLVNNAGIVRAAMIDKMTMEQWNAVIDVNLTAAFMYLQAVGQRLIEQSEHGDGAQGRIVNVSSDAGRRGTIGQINYGAAKAGVLGLTMSAAREWGRYHIAVNSVCFGLVETAMTEMARSEKFRDRFLQQIPMQRFACTDDVAPPTCFLLSAAASYITGQHLAIDGGFHITA